MSLFGPKLESDKFTMPLGIKILECDICHQRFSEGASVFWPFCKASIPHERIDSREQQRRANLLRNQYGLARPIMETIYQFIIADSHPNRYFHENELPSIPTPIDQVKLPRDKYTETRNRYVLLTWFASLITKIERPFMCINLMLLKLIKSASIIINQHCQLWPMILMILKKRGRN